jgi:hypothetical protein
MAKHGDNEDPKHKENYKPKHAGGQDGYEWAQSPDDTPTEEIPKQDGKKKGK